MQKIARKVVGGAAVAAIAMAGLSGSAWAVDPYPVVVKTKSDTDCSGATVDSNIPSGSGTLNVSVKGVCTFLSIKDPNAGGPTPVIVGKAGPVEPNMAGDRKSFEVPYDLPNKDACLEYFFRLTAGSNLPTETVGKLSHGYICGGK